MNSLEKFQDRIGKVHIPVAETIALAAQATRTDGPAPTPLLAQGCHVITLVPKPSATSHKPPLAGTLRVEQRPEGVRISGDLYTQPPIAPSDDRAARLAARRPILSEADGMDSAAIPILPRPAYVLYLRGVTATAASGGALTLELEEFRYHQPASGFSGSFPDIADRRVQWKLQTSAAGLLVGTAWADAVEFGDLQVRWVSPFFRRARLDIFQLTGAAVPQPVPSHAGAQEYFDSVFAGVGWDLQVNFAGEIPLPAELAGVQDPHQCWSLQALATLLGSTPGYRPSELDTIWRARLLAVPARLGCSRGEMFDVGDGDPGGIPREGAATHSDDGYPATDSPNFGAAQNGVQRNFPRAFLRSACHEVGHTFNQIHQELEGGKDNSVMTTTPSVADVLAAGGGVFPEDIRLGFNESVRRHLIHLPDPAVRPGGMEFFGSAVSAPQADEVSWPESLRVTLHAGADALTLGQPLELAWKLTNEGKSAMLVPAQLGIEDLTARVSSTDANGVVKFLRPVLQHACPHNSLQTLEQDMAVEGSATVFWGRDGFLFENPGRYRIDLILLWQVDGVYVGAAANTFIWVQYPLTPQDDKVARLMFHPAVGKAVASSGLLTSSLAAERLSAAMAQAPEHPACHQLKSMGITPRSLSSAGTSPEDAPRSLLTSSRRGRPRKT